MIALAMTWMLHSRLAWAGSNEGAATLARGRILSADAPTLERAGLDELAPRTYQLGLAGSAALSDKGTLEARLTKPHGSPRDATLDGFAPDDTIPFTLILTNHGDDTARFAIPEGPWVDLEIGGARHHFLASARGDALPIATVVVIPPDSHIEHTIAWDGVANDGQPMRCEGYEQGFAAIGTIAGLETNRRIVRYLKCADLPTGEPLRKGVR